MKSVSDLSAEQTQALVEAIAEANADSKLEAAMEALECEDEVEALPILLELVAEGAVTLDGVQPVYDAMAWDPAANDPAKVAALLAQTTCFEATDEQQSDDSDDDGDDDDDDDDDGYDDDFDDAYDDEYADEEDEEEEEPEVGDFAYDQLDKVAVAAYGRDKSAFAAWTEYAPAIRTWFATVVARAGDDVPPEIGREVLDALAGQHIVNWGIEKTWAIWTGEAVEQAPFFEDDSRDVPGARFLALVDQLGGQRQWAEALHAWAVKKTHDLSATKARPGLALATIDELPRMLDAANSTREIDVVYKLLLEDRSDTVEELLGLAEALSDGDRFSNYRMARLVRIAAVLRARDNGEAWPEERDETLDLTMTHCTVKDGVSAFQGIEPAVEVLRFVGRDRAIALLRSALAEPMAACALPLIAALEGEELIDEAIARVLGDLDGWYEIVVFGLATFGPRIVAPLRAYASKPPKSRTKDLVDVTIAMIMADQLDRGETPDPELDVHLAFDGWPDIDTVFRSSITPVLLRVLSKLPSDRVHAVLSTAVEAGGRAAARTLTVVEPGSDLALFGRALDQTLANPKSVGKEDRRDLSEGLNRLGEEERKRQVRRVLQRSTDKVLVKVLSDAIGQWQVEQIMAEVGTEVVAETKTEEILRLAGDLADFEGDRTRIYLLDRQSGSARTLSRIGSAPYPSDVPWWPKKEDGSPRQHLITLEVEAVPLLRSAFPDARAVSLFIDDPDHNEAYSPYNSETELVAVPKDTDPTTWADVAVEGDTGDVAVTVVDVPEAVFLDASSDPRLTALRGAIYQAKGRAGGLPLWLQSEEDEGGDFLLQFDEALVPMNLGDSGVMYVFDDTAFWQCH